MNFTHKLLEGTLIKRYKRFLADIQLTDGTVLTAYCPNTGSMRSCSSPGSRVMLSLSDNTERKYPHTLEMIEVDGGWVGVNTGLTNAIVAEGIENDDVKELLGWTAITREVTVTKGTRLDLMVERGKEKVYIEVKNCSLVENGRAMFPDAVTKRGTKHLEELLRCHERGDEAIIFYLVQRGDAEIFRPASHIDPVYGETLKRVHGAGVKILVYQAVVSPKGIQLSRKLEYELD